MSNSTSPSLHEPPPITAPWNREDIPDYGIVSLQNILISSFVIGVGCTLFYEWTDYFDQLNRFSAYFAIWFPLTIWVMKKSKDIPEEDEKTSFYKELDTLSKSKDE